MNERINASISVFSNLEASLAKFAEEGHATIALLEQHIERLDSQALESEHQELENYAQEIDSIRNEVILIKEEFHRVVFPFEQLLEQDIPDAVYWLRNKGDALHNYLSSSISRIDSYSTENKLANEEVSIEFDFPRQIIKFVTGRAIDLIASFLFPGLNSISVGSFNIALDVLGLSTTMPDFQVDMGDLVLSMQPELKIPFFALDQQFEIDANLQIHSNSEELNPILPLSI